MKGRERAGKLKGPGFGLVAALIALWLGAGWLLALGLAIFVGVIAATWGSRLGSGDRHVDGYGRHHGYGHHHVSGWMADGGAADGGGGFDGGGGDGGGGG